jgi:hypothetical protein
MSKVKMADEQSVSGPMSKLMSIVAMNKVIYYERSDLGIDHNKKPGRRGPGLSGGTRLQQMVKRKRRVHHLFDHIALSD